MKNKFKKLKENQKIIAIFGILILALVVVGLTYAFFSYSKEGSTENSIKSGSLTFWYDEQNRQGNSIGIEDALPMSDTDGKAQTQAFNFRITSTSASNIAIPYTITLRQKAGTDNIGEIVKVYLAKTTGYEAAVDTEEEVVTSLFSSLSDTTKNGYSEKVLYRDVVPTGSSNYNQNYRLKMWIDNDTDFSADQNGQYPYNNKTFTVMVNVYAEAHIASSNSNVTSAGINGTTVTATNVNGINTYSATLPVGTTQTTLNVETEDEYANVEVTKTLSDYTTPVAVGDNIQRLATTQNKKVFVDSGDNYFKVLVRSEDNSTSKELHFKISIEDPTLKGKILKDNPNRLTNPTLSATSDAAGEIGLYEISVTNGFGGQSTQGISYYFRGNVTNNYVRFAGLDWRIVRINEDGTVRLVLSGSTDSANHAYNASYQNYIYAYYTNSTAKTDLETWFNQTITGDNANKVASGNYFCEAAKVKKLAAHALGNANLTVYTSYTPNLVCPTDDGNGYGIVQGNPKIGLLTYDEVVMAGYRVGTNSSNYLTYNWSNSYWLMSPSNIDNSGTNLWAVNSANQLQNSYSRAGQYGDTKYYRPVINLKANVTATKNANGVYVID